MHRARPFLMLLGILLYLGALAMPVWECQTMHAQLSGLSVLMTGYMGLLSLDPRWFCNAVVLMALYSLFSPLKRPWLPLVLAGIASTTVVGPYFCSPGGGSLDRGMGMAVGGYLWIAALWLLAIAAYRGDTAHDGSDALPT